MKNNLTWKPQYRLGIFEQLIQRRWTPAEESCVNTLGVGPCENCTCGMIQWMERNDWSHN